MREYSFKPAPIRKAQTWAIKDHHLMRRGAQRALNLGDVTAASWNTVTYRGTRSAWLHLHTETSTTKVEYTDNGGARDEFLALIVAIAASLKQVNADLEIEYGYSPPWRLALFILGGLGALLGLFLVYVGLTNLTGQGAVQAMIAGAAMSILLIPVAWTCRPNMQAKTFGPDGLAAEIALMGGPSMPDPDHAASER